MPYNDLSLALPDRMGSFLSNSPNCRFLPSIHETHLRSGPSPSNDEPDQSKATSLVCIVRIEVLLR